MKITKQKSNNKNLLDKIVKCNDYDDECININNHFNCWIGGFRITRNGILVYTDIANGYCPFIHFSN